MQSSNDDFPSSTLEAAWEVFALGLLGKLEKNNEKQISEDRKVNQKQIV